MRSSTAHCRRAPRWFASALGRARRRSRHTVASPKYQAPLRDIPQTIEVIPRAAMDAQGVTTLSEALRNVPGITMQAGEGGGASSTAGDMFHIQQVEVFMGPTGSDVGRGTAAGCVNMQTKMPQTSNTGSATVTYGAANQRRATADVNREFNFGRREGWLSKSAVRLNVLWQDSGVPGRDEVENATKALAPTIAAGADDVSGVAAQCVRAGTTELPVVPHASRGRGHAVASVLGEPRPGFARHAFVGGNAFMLRMLNRYRDDLGVAADSDPSGFERHYAQIRERDQVQFYASVMRDAGGRTTTGLLQAVGYLEDNRLLPRGFDKASADASMAVVGDAAQDKDFNGGGDVVRYSVGPAGYPGPYQVSVSLRFQSIGFRWAENLKAYDAPEPQRFLRYYAAMASTSSEVLSSISGLTCPAPGRSGRQP